MHRIPARSYLPDLTPADFFLFPRMNFKGAGSRVSSKQSNFVFGSNRNKPKLNLFRLFFGLFRETKNIFFGLFWFDSVCFGVSDRYRNNRKKTQLCQNKLKNLQKTFYNRGSSKQLIFLIGSNRNKPKLNLFLLFFGLFFEKPNNFFFGLFRCFGPLSKQPKQTELKVWGIKKVDILTNLLLFRLVFCLFQLFRNTETPCFDI